MEEIPSSLIVNSPLKQPTNMKERARVGSRPPSATQPCAMSVMGGPGGQRATALTDIPSVVHVTANSLELDGINARQPSECGPITCFLAVVTHQLL